MTILTFPSLIPSKVTWSLVSNTEQFTSPLNGSTQTAGRPGSRWKAALDFIGMDKATSASFDAFLASLDGMAGRFYLYPHHRPGGGINGAVAGASQVGTSLNVTVAAGRTFAPGDFFAVNNELKMITAAAVANGSGAVTLSFSPMLRASPANAAAVVFNQPTVLMRLDANEYAFTRTPDFYADVISIPCIEAFQ